MRKFVVIGSPILQSQSPQIFKSLVNNANQIYFRISVQNAEEAVYLIKELNINGANITAPFKSEIMQYLNHIDKYALKIGAINTIDNENNSLRGYNTDYIGIIESLKSFDLINKNCIILGAGGAARATVYALKKLQANITIINRNAEKAKDLADEFKCQYATLDILKDKLISADLLVYALPPDAIIIPKEYYNSQLIFFDANYVKSINSESAKVCAFRYISGINWLYNQALPSYKLFCKDNGLKICEIKSEFNDLNFSKIALIGFMGVGKSSVGKVLANKLNYDFADIDAIIESRCGKSIPEIFKCDGEKRFREIETAVLNELINKDNIVISCGGGIVEARENIFQLKQNTLSIWLYANLETCLARADNTDRPLINQAEKLFSDREDKYASACEMLVNTVNKDIESIANQIYNEIHQTQKY